MIRRGGPNAMLFILTCALMLVGLYMALLYAPTEQTMGDVQRIFYFHVPMAWVAFLAFFLVFLFSIIYLMKREKKWDILAGASAEVGVLFCTLVLITGPIWAKPVWGIWWTWDARLTLTLVLWLIYIGYLMLRHYVVDPEKKAAFSAVLGIIGFVDVPIVHMSIRWWRTQHPQPVIAGGEESGLAPSMMAALIVCLAASLLLFIYLFRKRAALESMTEDLEELRQRAEDMGKL